MQRTERVLSWRQVAEEIWNQSVVLNRRRQSHPISPSTLPLIMRIMRWLERPAAAFIYLSGALVTGMHTSAGPETMSKSTKALTVATDERQIPLTGSATECAR
jgi:hypothetical protein